MKYKSTSGLFLWSYVSTTLLFSKYYTYIPFLICLHMKKSTCKCVCELSYVFDYKAFTSIFSISISYLIFPFRTRISTLTNNHFIRSDEKYFIGMEMYSESS